MTDAIWNGMLRGGQGGTRRTLEKRHSVEAGAAGVARIIGVVD